MKEFAKKILKSLPIAFTKNQQYDRHTERVLAIVGRRGANCVDVGCHKGEVLELMLKYAPQGQHYGFEPIPELYAKLTAHFGHHANCHFYQLGLSNVTGETSFNYVLTNPAYSGFIKRKYDKLDEVDTLITVQKRPLDQVLPPNTRIDLIKIDVEGAELEVLQGATQTIKQSRPVIIFEHGLGASDYYDTRPEQVYDLLTDVGALQISTMERWLAGRPGFRRAEFVEQFDKSLNYYFIAYPPEKTRAQLSAGG